MLLLNYIYMYLVFVLLQNLGEEPFNVDYGDRVSQLIIEYVAPTTIQ